MERFYNALIRLYFACALVSIYSCAPKIFDLNYKGAPNYESFYLVDTIRIQDPVRIHSANFGGQFILSRDVLKEYKQNREFFERPDVFLLGEDLYRDLSPKYYNQYFYNNNGGCKYEKSTLKVGDLEIFEIKSTAGSFLLGLINANYFYIKHNSDVSFQFCQKGGKIAYYKIVYPLCD